MAVGGVCVAVLESVKNSDQEEPDVAPLFVTDTLTGEIGVRRWQEQEAS